MTVQSPTLASQATAELPSSAFNITAGHSCRDPRYCPICTEALAAPPVDAVPGEPVAGNAQALAAEAKRLAREYMLHRETDEAVFSAIDAIARCAMTRCPVCGWSRGHDYGCPNDPLNPGGPAAVPGEPAEFERVARLLDTRGSDEDRYAAKIIRAQAAWADRLSGERNAAHAALQELIPMFAAWHEEFPDDVGDKEGPALSRARDALAAPVASRAGMEPVAVKREQQISKAAHLIFEAYNMPRDRYPDDYSYSLFVAGKVREAHGVMQCIRGVATWSADNCAAPLATAGPAEAKDAVRAEPVAQVGWRDATYVDSTPRLHVGSSAFEDWFQAQPFACQSGIKQISRDSYAAGMGDPLVTYAAPPTLRQPEAAGEAPADSSGAGRLAVPDGMVMVPRSVLGWHIKPVGEEPECCDRGRRPDGSISDECCGNGACCQTREEAEARRSWEGILATDAAAEGGQA